MSPISHPLASPALHCLTPLSFPAVKKILFPFVFTRYFVSRILRFSNLSPYSTTISSKTRECRVCLIDSMCGTSRICVYPLAVHNLVIYYLLVSEKKGETIDTAGSIVLRNGWREVYQWWWSNHLIRWSPLEGVGRGRRNTVHSRNRCSVNLPEAASAPLAVHVLNNSHVFLTNSFE